MIWRHILLASVTDPEGHLEITEMEGLGYPKFLTEEEDIYLLWMSNGVVVIEKELLRELGYSSLSFRKDGRFLHFKLK
ncbi:MAG: hypothetical protein QXR62_03590 [Candidatus Bathyarchaeia archaeon]